MLKNSTQPVLLQKLFELLGTHRSAFRQERVYWRAVGMMLGEVFNFGRHTVTQSLMALGMTDGDWSSWYRLFSRRRYEEKKVAQIFFRETLQHVNPEEPDVVGADGVQIPRSSLKMPGTSWMKAPRRTVMNRGSRFSGNIIRHLNGEDLMGKLYRRLEQIVSVHARAKPIICDGNDNSGGEPNSQNDVVFHAKNGQRVCMRMMGSPIAVVSYG